MELSRSKIGWPYSMTPPIALTFYFMIGNPERLKSGGKLMRKDWNCPSEMCAHVGVHVKPRKTWVVPRGGPWWRGWHDAGREVGRHQGRPTGAARSTARWSTFRSTVRSTTTSRSTSSPSPRTEATTQARGCCWRHSRRGCGAPLSQRIRPRG